MILCANSTLSGANFHQRDELIPELLGAVRTKVSNILFAVYSMNIYIYIYGKI